MQKPTGVWQKFTLQEATLFGHCGGRRRLGRPAVPAIPFNGLQPPQSSRKSLQKHMNPHVKQQPDMPSRRPPSSATRKRSRKRAERRSSQLGISKIRDQGDTNWPSLCLPRIKASSAIDMQSTEGKYLHTACTPAFLFSCS